MRTRLFAAMFLLLAMPLAARAADTIRLAQATTSLSFLPIWAARALDTFSAENLTLQWVAVPGGDPSALAALDGGDVDVAAVGSDTALAAIGKGQPFEIVGSLMDRVSLDLVASTEFLKRENVSVSDPLEKRIATLKGAVVGVSAVGGAQDRAVRWLAAHGGVDPKSLQVALVGGPPALQAALENSRIDAFILSPPEAQIAIAGGYGEKLVGMSDDFPQLRAVPFLVLVAKTPVADPARLTRLLRALASGSDSVMAKPDDTADAIEKAFFPKLPAPIIRAGVAALRDGVAGKGALDPAHVEAMIHFSRESGIAVDGVDVSRLWTSTYIDDALKK